MTRSEVGCGFEFESLYIFFCQNMCIKEKKLPSLVLEHSLYFQLTVKGELA
jgi:hypothetical protein